VYRLVSIVPHERKLLGVSELVEEREFLEESLSRKEEFIAEYE
jgi:hypothetical protein